MLGRQQAFDVVWDEDIVSFSSKIFVFAFTALNGFSGEGIRSGEVSGGIALKDVFIPDQPCLYVHAYPYNRLSDMILYCMKISRYMVVARARWVSHSGG